MCTGPAAFVERLTAARKQRPLTQAALAERSDGHVTQIRRYEAGTSAPTRDALRNLTIALNITTDSLVFDPTERGPSDDLALHPESIEQLDADGSS